MAKMGGARTFFTIYANMQSQRLLKDAQASSVVMRAVFLDALEGIVVGYEEMFDVFNQATDAIVEQGRAVDEARIHYEKYFEGNIAQAKELEDALVSAGSAFAQTAQQSIEAGAQMARIQSGIGGAGSAAGAVQASFLLGSVGEMGTERAMRDMISLQQQTRYMTRGVTEERFKSMSAQQQANHVMQNNIILIDQLNEVSNQANADIGQMTNAMSRFASTAAGANMPLSEQIALTATLIEQGEEQGRAGTAMKMILTRLATNRSKNNELLAEHGIAVKDELGNMRPLLDILQEIDVIYDDLNGTQRTQMATAIAGAHHTERFTKLVTSTGRALELQATATGAAGSAMKEFEAYLRTPSYQLSVLERQIEAVQLEIYNNLIPGEVMAGKTTLALNEAMLDLSNNGIGKALFSSMAVGDSFFKIFGGAMRAFMAIKAINIAFATLAMMFRNTNRESQLYMTYQQQEIDRQPVLTHAKLEYAMALRSASAEQALLKIMSEGYYSSTALGMRTAQQSINDQVTSLKGLISAQNYLNTQLQEKTFLDIQHTHHASNAYKAQIQSIKEITVAEFGLLNMAYQSAIQERKNHKETMRSAIRERDLLQHKATLQVMSGNAEANQTVALLKMQNLKIDLIEAEDMRRKLLIDTLDAELMAEYNGLVLAGKNVEADQLAAAAIKNRADATRFHTGMQEINNDITQISIDMSRLERDEDYRNAMAKKILADMTKKQGDESVIATLKGMYFTNGTFNMAKGMQTLSTAAMGASFAVHLFADGTDAAEAQMVTMALSMVPMVVGTTFLTAAQEGYNLALVKTIVLQAAATMAISLVIAAIAVGIARMMDFGGQAEDMAEAFDWSGKGAFDIDFNDIDNFSRQMDTMTSGIDDATDSIAKFDDMRLSVFFGGNRKAMQGAMFNELKQNGVENLYFAPEIHMVNNFHGLTMDAAAQTVARIIMNEISEGNLQLPSK